MRLWTTQLCAGGIENVFHMTSTSPDQCYDSEYSTIHCTTIWNGMTALFTKLCVIIQKVIGSYLSPSRALCYAPTFYGNGKVKFKLLLDGTEVEKQDTYYLACKLFVNNMRTVFLLPRMYV